MEEAYNADDLLTRISELEKELAVEKAKKSSSCNRCGRENKESDIKVSEPVLQEYFRSLLGQVPFSHTFEAFGGRLKITCVAQQGDALIERYKRKSSIAGQDMVPIIVSTVRSIEVVDTASGYSRSIYEMTPEQLVDNIKNPEAAYEKLLSCLDAVKLSVVKNACRAFTVLILTLIDEADSEDFYKGAGLV